MLPDFDGEADFDTGPGTAMQNSPIDDDDIFIAKYDLDFNLIWVKQVGGATYQKVFAIETDKADDIYITGHFNSTTILTRPQTHLLTSKVTDIFVLKLNEAGVFKWVAQFSGNFYGSGHFAGW